MTDDFAPDGQLAKAIPGFKPREPQRQMAVAVTQAIEKGQPLVVEAGTGTGKTYAYPGSCAAGEKESHYLDRLKSVAGSALQAAICQQSQRH
ncbi:putative ATP-binding protein [Escherichia coli]|uniref:Putative ATP-binding protein n=1 Tax=Escherichia coli TaxID=562 RepID=A0A376KTQ7_ECOLX|nr:putative ATP-binding protein [Escherichia coli]